MNTYGAVALGALSGLTGYGSVAGFLLIGFILIVSEMCMRGLTRCRA